MNPMIRKELRQRMRERRGWILPSLYLVALGAIITLAYYTTTHESWRNVQGWQVGVALFFTAGYTQLALLLLMAPIFGAGALTIEKEQRTLPGLLTSLLGPMQIWWGKFAASLLFLLLLLVAGFPILSAVFAFGGIGLYEVGMESLTTVVILGTICAASLYWSSVFRRSVHATAVSYVTVIVLTAVTFIISILWMSRHPGAAWSELPLRARAALYFNPVFFLTMSFAPKDQLYPEWFVCLALYLFLAALSSVLTLRNIRRSGDTA
jgi:ABC-type transport system involved in multi-copper enzyme maturation permease subunit